MAATVRLMVFGGVKQVTGTGELDFPLEAACTAAELFDAVCARYPGLAAHQRSIRLAVNGSYVKAGERVSPGDEVALIPPVAGG